MIMAGLLHNTMPEPDRSGQVEEEMSTAPVKQNNESDILSIIRELHVNEPARGPEVKDDLDAGESPNPAKLLESLQKKRDLINLIGGYADVSDIGTMKVKLNDAIADLEEILEATA
jgi:hypothetical protein